MASRSRGFVVVLGLLVAAAGVGATAFWRPSPEVPVVGIVRATEIRVAPEAVSYTHLTLPTNREV